MMTSKKFKTLFRVKMGVHEVLIDGIHTCLSSMSILGCDTSVRLKTLGASYGYDSEFKNIWNSNLTP